MRLSNFNIKPYKKDYAEVSCLLSKNNKQQNLWFRIPKNYDQYLSENPFESFVLAVLYDAMLLKEDIHVEGILSSRFIMNVENYMVGISSFYTTLGPVNLLPSEISNKQLPRGNFVGLGFSAGVDSFSTLQDRFLENENHLTKITHLINLNVGAHGKAQKGRDLWQQRLMGVKEIAASSNLELLIIDSNIDEISEISFEDSYPAKIASCILLLDKAFRIYYISSNNHYKDLCAEPSNSLTDHLLSNNICEIIHDGSRYSRIQKILRLSTVNLTYKYLNVCTSPDTNGQNCSDCSKCIRTMYTMELLGVAKNYEKVFDFTNFEKKKAWFINKMEKKGTTAPNYYWKEIVDFLNDSHSVKQDKKATPIQLKTMSNDVMDQKIFTKPIHKSPLPLPPRLTQERAYFFYAKKNLQILEIGCNSSQIKTFLQNLGHTYTGFDLNSKYADINGDLNNMPFEKSSFDCILINSTLQFSNNPFIGLSECFRVLRSGSFIVGTVPFLEPFKWGGNYNFTPTGIHQILEEVGFKVQNIWPSWTTFEAIMEGLEGINNKQINEHLEFINLEFTNITKKNPTLAFEFAGSLNFYAIK